MTAPTGALARRQLAAPGTVLLLLGAALAWLGLLQLRMTDMNAATGFIPAWALMMTAMMLPAVTPVAMLYARTIQPGRRLRLAAFAGGYLCVWVASALPAFGSWTAVRRVVLPHPLAARLVGAVIFAASGLYQLSPLKDRCLRHCRSPLGQLMRYASFKGPARDARVGLHHAAYCLGCCWALMLLLFAFGTMNVLAALSLASVVIVEKLSPWGQRFSRAVGVAALLWAVVVLIDPALAPGLQPMAAMTPMATSPM